MAVLPDAKTRLQAVKDFEHNLVVVAGAGTGKTSLLVGRLASALIRHRFEPRQVQALTFTENAASEMRHRLKRLLESAARLLDCRCADACDCEQNCGGIDASDRATIADLELGSENRGRIEDILEQIDEVPLETFHKFCARLLSQNAQLLNLPPDLSPGADDLARPAFDEAYLDFLRNLDPLATHEALELFEARDLGTLAWQLRKLPNEGLRELLAEPPRIDPQELAEIVDKLESLRAEWMDSKHVSSALTRGKFAKQLDGLLAACAALASGSEQEPFDWPTGNKIQVGSSTKPDTKAFATRARSIFEACQQRVEPYARARDDDIAKAVAFLQPFVEQTHHSSLQQGVFTFDALVLETRHRLMVEPEFRRAAGQGLRALLVDEFQDTDPLQYDIVFMLAARPDVDGVIEQPLEVALRPDVLFIVGDPKQSIYRFRRADITAFEQARSRVLAKNGRGHDLTSNFRSRPAILDEVNRVCAITLAADPPYQLGYEPVIPMAPAPDDGRVEYVAPVDLDPPPPDDKGKEPKLLAAQRRRLEGALCVTLIEELRGRGVDYGDMAILLRKTTETTTLLRPLRAAGIPYVLTGSKRFYERHEIVVATALLTATARPHDRVAVLAILRSAFSGATDRDIEAYLGQHGPRALDPRNLPDDAAGPVAETLTWLHRLHLSCQRRPVDAAIEHILGLEAWTIIEGSGFEGAQSLANLDRLRDELLRARPLDLADAAEFLEHHTRHGTDDEESPLFDEGLDAVRIMTVHGSKGLEFGAVILPDLAGESKSNRSDSPGVSCLRAALASGATAVGVKIGDARNFADFELEQEQAAHGDAEAERLLYVALTRARQSLHIIRSAKANAGSWQASLEQAGLLDSTPTREVGVEPDARRRTAPKPTVKPNRTANSQRALAAWRAHELATTDPTDHSEAGPTAPATPPPPSSDPTARDLGIAVHRYLALARLDETFDPELNEACAAVAPVEAATLRAIVEPVHGSALATRLANAIEVRREFPVSYIDARGEPEHGILDLLLLEPGGHWTVIDHKTDAVASDEEVLATAAERHRSQLERYADGIQRALALDAAPRCAVHFVRASAVIELAPR